LRGRYIEVERPRRLVWTWAWDHESLPPRRVMMTFAPLGAAATRLGIAHEAATDEERRSYIEGWEHFLGELQKALAAGD
jgi:uncharacterized protein YndB with AHSA1/START domain